MKLFKVSVVVCLCLSAAESFAGVKVSFPTSGSSLTGPVQFIANGSSPDCAKGVDALGIYTAPNLLAYVTKGSTLNTTLRLSPGNHDVTVRQWDKCGWTAKATVSVQVISAVPRSKHVWIITEENHSYERVIGNSNMPYFNFLASKYALATNYYANRHSSLPALMWLVAGQDVTTDNGTKSCFDVENVVRELLLNGMSWKSYQEDLPYAGFTGLSWADYVRRHNPLIDFTDVCTPSQKLNSVPYSQLATDMANDATPNYIYITPNLMHDAHNGTREQADDWLSKQVPKILARPEFQSTGDGLLFIAWDEGDIGKSSDDRCSPSKSTGCGGRVATLVIGPKVKHNFKSQTLYHHQNLLRTVCDAMTFATCPGAGANASPMTDFF